MEKIEIVSMHDVEDESIQGVGWKKGVPAAVVPRMFVRYRNGNVLCYYGVPKAVFEATLAAGKHVVKHIAGNVHHNYGMAHLIENQEVIFTWKMPKKMKPAPIANLEGKINLQESRWDW